MQAKAIVTTAVLTGLMAVLPGCLTLSVNGIKPHSRVVRRPAADIPLAKTFWSIHRERNVVGRNDCSNKSGRYARELRKHGIQADVIVISRPRERNLHAVVQLGDGRCLDPVDGKMADRIADFGQVKMVLAGNVSTWGSEFN